MTNKIERLKVAKIIALLTFSLFLVGLASVGSLYAQLKKEEVNFEVLDTVTMKSGDVLWNLAEKYYKDPMKWKYIAQLNKIPNERKIAVGTVIYIPASDAKAIVKEADKAIEAKKVTVDENALKLAELQKEIERLKKEFDDALARNRELAAALKQREDMIAELEAKIRALNGELQAQAELEGRMEDMRVAAKATSEKKDELAGALREKDALIAEKEARIAEIEWKLKQSQNEISKLESARDELNMKIEKAEKWRTEQEKPSAKAKYAVSDSRSRIAALAIALVGSIIWMASDK